jgi:DNA-binding MarR family transcriptional regulator
MAKVLSAIERLRRLEREIPTQVCSVFLYIASHNPCNKEAIEEDLEFTSASCSRNIAWLTDTHRLKKPGLGLIKKTREGRRLMLSLTEEGEALVHDLYTDLYD